MKKRRGKRHSPEQIIKKLREADTISNKKTSV